MLLLPIGEVVLEFRLLELRVLEVRVLWEVIGGRMCGVDVFGWRLSICTCMFWNPYVLVKLSVP